MLAGVQAGAAPGDPPGLLRREACHVWLSISTSGGKVENPLLPSSRSAPTASMTHCWYQQRPGDAPSVRPRQHGQRDCGACGADARTQSVPVTHWLSERDASAKRYRGNNHTLCQRKVPLSVRLEVRSYREKKEHKYYTGAPSSC